MSTYHKLIQKDWVKNALLTIGAILCSFLVSSLIMLVVGYEPIAAFSALWEGAFGSMPAMANTLSKSVPLIFTGLAFAFASKGGVFNIGGEGQLYAGAMAATLTVLALDGMPRLVVIPVAILAGAIGGAAVGGVTGIIKAKLNVNEVIVAIMMNYIVLYATSYLVSYPFKEEGAMTAQTVPMGEQYMLTKLIDRTQLTSGFILAVVVAIILVVFFQKTRAGYNIRIVGENKHAALASGVSMSITAIATMSVSGALAGLAGVTEVMGKSGRFTDGFSNGFGFTGIAVAVLANNNPIAILFSAILFGALEAGAMKMSYSAGISSSMVLVIQGMVILFVATPNLLRFAKKQKGGK